MKRIFLSLVSTALFATAVFAQQIISVEVDATEAPRRIFHSTISFPDPAPEVTLHYPKWFPGTHSPTGKVVDLVGLTMSASGKEITWRRDPYDMFTFHCTVPENAGSLEVKFDFVVPTGTQARHHPAASSSYAAMINWASLVLYPKGADVKSLRYAPALKLPAGWKYGSALRAAKQSENRVEFDPVPLYTLIDSPVIAGAHFQTLDLNPGSETPYRMHLAADSAAALQMKPEALAGFRKLVQEELALFGTRHFDQYHFLLTLSDPLSGGAVEHHECSENRARERMFLDDDLYLEWVDVLPHEMVHSWNGKYRRPDGLNTRDYQEAIHSELLWVYEGLTNYLGYVLAARSGLMNEQDFRDATARLAAALDQQAGRSWRPLEDTTVAAQSLTSTASDEWETWRRGLDYYDEGVLIWLEADVLLRQLTKGRASLDDFCRKFFGGQNSSPAVSAFTMEDLIAAMNQIAPHDWKAFFTARVEQLQIRAPLGGIEQGGWRLVYSEKRTPYYTAMEKGSTEIDERFSIGVLFKEDGVVVDVVPGKAAAESGLAPGMKILGVSGRRWSESRIREAIQASGNEKADLELLAENGDFYKSFALRYHGGAKYPVLERNVSIHDTLSEILKPRTTTP